MKKSIPDSINISNIGINNNNMSHSVYAEPVGIYLSLAHLLRKEPGIRYRMIDPRQDADFGSNNNKKFCELSLGTSDMEVFDSEWRQAITVATDNSSAKFTFGRGFASRSYIINEAIKKLKQSFPPETFDFKFCFVPGHLNPADKPSRGYFENGDAVMNGFDLNNNANSNNNNNSFTSSGALQYNNISANNGQSADISNLQRLAGVFQKSNF